MSKIQITHADILKAYAERADRLYATGDTVTIEGVVCRLGGNYRYKATGPAATRTGRLLSASLNPGNPLDNGYAFQFLDSEKGIPLNAYTRGTHDGLPWRRVPEPA